MSMLHRSRAFGTYLNGSSTNASRLTPRICISAHQSHSYSKKSEKRGESKTSTAPQSTSKVSKDLHKQNERLQRDEIIKQKAEEKSPGNDEKKAIPTTGLKSGPSGSDGK